MLSLTSLQTLATFIQLGIAAAPVIEDEVKKAKDLITELFSKGLISKAQQDELHAFCDADQAAALAGEVPEAWIVRPDPITT